VPTRSRCSASSLPTRRDGADDDGRAAFVGPFGCPSAAGRATIAGVTTVLIYLVVMVLVAGVVFLLVSAVFGRGEEMAALPPGASPTRLPGSDIRPEDVRGLRFQLVLRGYRMSEVDWALDRLAGEVGALRDRVAELEHELGRTNGGPAGPAVSTGAGTEYHHPQRESAP
jgi:DivIVA domain-containing protein